MKARYFLLALCLTFLPVRLSATIVYTLQGQPIYYYALNGYAVGACTYTPQTYTYGATTVNPTLATSNGILMKSSGFDNISSGGNSWLDFNDLTTIAQSAGGGTPPPTGTITVKPVGDSSGSSGAASGVQLNWTITPSSSSP